MVTNNMESISKWHNYLRGNKGPDIMNKYVVSPDNEGKWPVGIVPEYDGEKDIIMTMTTCKRLPLFMVTMHSLLSCALDAGRVKVWFIVDDNSTDSDRREIVRCFPFMKFYFKNAQERGHAQSMNIILDHVRRSECPYWFHLEDDWKFYRRDSFLSRAIRILECPDAKSDNTQQVLFNPHYAETTEDIAGGKVRRTDKELYIVHWNCYTEREYNEFNATYPGRSNCAYWPHFSLRPSIMRSSAILGMDTKFDPFAEHFEMAFAEIYARTFNFTSAFLPILHCAHIGRLCSERFDPLALNAYVLNDQDQFNRRPTWRFKPYLLSLLHRSDRLKVIGPKVPEILREDLEVVYGVNGKLIEANQWLLDLFAPNDYNYRRGIVGCALSVLNMVTWLANEKEERTAYLFLEDDVTFAPHFSEQYALVKNWIRSEIGSEFDILIIGQHAPTPPSVKLTIEKCTARQALDRSKGGTFGFLMSRNGARKFLDFINTRRMTNAIDTMMQLSGDTLNLYYTSCALVIAEMANENDHVDSDIQHDFHPVEKYDNPEETSHDRSVHLFHSPTDEDNTFSIPHYYWTISGVPFLGILNSFNK